MSAVMFLDSYSRSAEATPSRSRKPWPTMYDLPSENPEDPGVPDVFHLQQPQLLKETFQPPAYPSDNVFVASDLNLYYDRQHDHWYKRPDWFAVVGVSPLYQDRDQRYSYVVWDEKVTPILVVELLSPSTKNDDLGRTPKPKQGPPTKWEVYEQILQIPYYVIFSRETDEVQFFKLMQGSYVKIPSLTHTLWMPELELGLGRWKGVYDGCERQWIRWYDKDGRWIPTPAERATRAEQQMELERERAARAEQQMELERQQALLERERAARAEQQMELERQQALLERERAARAEQQALSERQRATQAEQQVWLERQQAQQLAAKLRALGIDPEKL